MPTKFFHKCLFFNFLFVLFLVSCGGSGGDKGASNNPPSSSASNATPTLTGIFNLEAKAQNTSTLILTAADKENDALQISLANKPDWLSVELKNDQVTITAKPDFFDIAEQKFTLVISDGKSSREYPLLISVVDNSSKWVTQTISSKDLIGSWQIDDGSRLYIYPNGSGIFISSDNQPNILNWLSDEKSFINLETRDKTCEDCIKSFQLSAVAKKDGNLRLRLNDSPTAVNAKKLSFVSPIDGNYFAIYNYPSSGSYSQVSGNGKDLFIKASVETTLDYGTSKSHTLYSLNFSAQLNKADANLATFKATDLTSFTTLASFTNTQTSKREQLTFKAKFSTIELLPSTAKDLIVHVIYKMALAGDSEKLDINNYESALTTYLNSEHDIYHESIKANATTAPKIAAGDKYYLPNASGHWNGINYTTASARSSATTLVFETAATGYVLLEGPLFSAIQKTPFTWSATNETLALKLTDDLSVIDYSFTLENGTLFALNNTSRVYSPAVKADANFSTPLATGYYFGNIAHKPDYFDYQYLYLSIELQKGNQLVITPAKRPSLTYHLRTESDNSITLLTSSLYCSLESFSLCEESIKANLVDNPSASLTYVNYKPIAKNGDLYTFAQTRYFIANSGNTISQSIVNLTYDELGMLH